MDDVPFDFRERVAALWKCCEVNFCFVSGEIVHKTDVCVDELVPDCEWTMKSRKKMTEVFIGLDNGTWKHWFRNLDRRKCWRILHGPGLSMHELKKHPNLKNVTIRNIAVTTSVDTHLWCSDATEVEDMEALVKFVAFLSNEPQLKLTHDDRIADSPEAATLIACLSRFAFSTIDSLLLSSPFYNQIVENQFSNRNPTAISVSVLENAFIAEHIVNGNIKRFSARCCFFPLSILERTVNSFLNSPEYYRNFHVEVGFETVTQSLLDRKLEEGLCDRSDDGSYNFRAYNTITNECLRVECEDFYWRKVIMKVLS